MADPTDRQSIPALLIWKCLEHLSHRRHEPEHKSSYRPRVDVPPRPSNQLRNQPEPPIWDETEFQHVSRRKRRLSATYPCQEVGFVTLQTVEEQTDCPLFKLPKEIRLLIYEQVLGDRVIHILRRKKRLGHRICKGTGDFKTCVSNNCRGFKIQTGICAGPGGGNMIQILQSCRRVYSEAVDVLYSSNVFNFDSLEAFVAFTCAILPHRLDSIRSLQLDFRFNMSPLYSECTPHNNFPRWERAWRIMATMMSLREIWMRFVWQNLAKSPFEEARILDPLRLVTGLKTFDVIMPHGRKTWVKHEAEEKPFRILLTE